MKKEVIRLNPECISCLMKSRLEQYPEGTEREQQIEYMQRVMKVVSEAPKSMSAPVVVREIYRIQKEMFGMATDYTDVKNYFNKWMLTKETMLEERVQTAQEPLKLALQYAMTGNYIDFGAMNKVDEEQLDRFLNEAPSIPVNQKEYESLRAEILSAKNLVYITDNCGEIVMDKILMREIRRLNQDITITALVRGFPVLNDATLEDATQVNLSDVAEVIDNGSDIAGTDLTQISKQAKEIIDAADLIIAKGQGNFETLQQCGENIYYIFMCKCDLFATRFQVPRYSGMLINDKNIVI